MNDHDSLEAELAALEPHEPSPSLRQRIADQLQTDLLEPARSRSSRAWWSGAATGGLLVVVGVAVCLLLLLRPAPQPVPGTKAAVAAAQLSVAAAFDDSLPTVWTYQRALFRSPQDLETLLDMHAATRPSEMAATPRHLFIQSDSQWPFQGEL